MPFVRKRRRFTRSFAGRRGGRNFFWFRFTPFALTLEEAATATHSSLFLDESDWANPNSELNEAQRGGARLERLICEFGLTVDGDAAFFAPFGSANLTLIPEWMIWKQSDQFASLASSSAQFDATRNNQRIIMDTVPIHRDSMVRSEANGQLNMSVRGDYTTKSKVRLADGALGVAWRGLFDTADANLNAYTDWFRPTVLMSTP